MNAPQNIGSTSFAMSASGSTMPASLPPSSSVSGFSVDAAAVRAATVKSRPDASAGIPRAPADPFADFRPAFALKSWDRERGFIRPAMGLPVADLYACWSPGGIVLGLYAFDIVERDYYRDASVPKMDRALWTIRVDGRVPVHARIGAGREALVDEERVRLESLSGLNLNVRNVAAMELPAALLGRAGFKAGDEIELDVSLLTHARAYRMEWKGRFRLAE